MMKKHKSQQPKGSPLWPHIRGWCARIGPKGNKKLVTFRGTHEEALAKFYQRMVRETSEQIATPFTQVEVPPQSVPHVTQIVEQLELAGVSVPELRRQYLIHKQQKLEEGELRPSSHRENKSCTEAFANFYGGLAQGLTPSDFAKFRKSLVNYAVPTRDRYITQVKAMFNWGVANGVISQLPNYGAEFARPSKAAKRHHDNGVRKECGPRLFTPREVRKLLKAADPIGQAMILLGVNCGFKNSDLGLLTKDRLSELGKGFIDYPRHKTGVQRQAVVWSRTVKTIRVALEQRPAAAKLEYEDRVFLTSEGVPVYREWHEKVGDKLTLRKYDSLPHWFQPLREKAGVADGKGFSLLRHTCRTLASESADKEAVDLVMGHGIKGMGGSYQEKQSGTLISMKRLRRVSDQIHFAVFGRLPSKSKKSKFGKGILTVSSL